MMQEETNEVPPTPSKPVTTKFLCFSSDCCIHFTGAFILAILIFESYFACTIDFNEYFSDLYYYLIVLCILPLFISATLYGIFWMGCREDSNRLPLAILLASISCFLIFLWINIYIWALYDYKQVYVGGGPKAEVIEDEN